MRQPKRKSFEIFNGLFDYGSGAIRQGFYPSSVAGQSAPPVNLARSLTGDLITPKRAMELSAAWACVWLIADTIATLPFLLHERTGEGAFGVPATGNPLYTVLGRKPNLYMGAIEFWRFILASELLWGNGYALKGRNGNGDVISLATMLPQYTLPYKVIDTGELRYKYMPGGQYTNEAKFDYSMDQIYHYKTRSLDGITGMSVIEYARNSLGIARAAEEATADVWRNGMRSSGFLMYDRVMKDKQRDEVQASLDKFKRGGKDAASLMVLEAGMTYQSLSINPDDAQLLMSRQYSVEDVCRWYGVPPILVGHASAGVTAWGTGLEQIMLGFLALTLRPKIRALEESVPLQLVQPAQQSTLYLTVDTDDLLGADSAARSALYSAAGQNGWMTRNEIRAKEDLPPKEGGDELTVQSNLIPLSKIEQMGGQPTPAPVPPPAAVKPPPKAIAA